MHLRPRPSSRRRTVRRVVALLAAGAVTAHAAAAGAAWSTAATGTGTARAASVAAVGRPTTAAVAKGTTTSSATTNLATTVAWSAPDAHPSTGYTLTRISASGQSSDTGANCLGTVVAQTCTENLGNNAGSWAYRVTPRLGTWVASASPPSVAPTDLVLANGGQGGTVGAINQGDTITIHFSAAPDPANICTSPNGRIGLQIRNDEAPGSGNDLLTFVSYSGSGCQNPTIGAIDLGSRHYVTAHTTFNQSNTSRSTYTVSGNALVVSIGGQSSDGSTTAAVPCGANVDTCPVATFVPHTELTAANGVAVTGTVTKQARNF
jgi:hypothetical protein